MGSNSRDLRVRFIGDAGSLKSTFAEVTSGAAATAQGLGYAGASADNVGRTFTKTGKVFKSTGKLLKSSGLDAASAGSSFLSTIPALSGVSTATGGLIVGLESLTQVAASVGPAGLAVMAVAAVGAGAAFVVLRDRVGAAESAMNVMTEANKRAISASRAAEAAAMSQAESVDAARSASISEREAVLRLADAHKAVQAALKESGRGSIEYRRALLDEQRAEIELRTAKRERIKAGQEAVRQAQESNRKSREAIKAAQDEVQATSKNTLANRLGVIQGKDAARQAALNAAAQRRLGDAIGASTAKHLENAKRASAAAAAMGSATPKAAALSRQLRILSQLEINRALAASIAAIGSAANSASAGVQHLIELVRASQSTRRGGGGVGGGGGGGGGGTQSADARTRLPSNPSFALMRVPIGSPTDLSRVGSRGDRAANTARVRAERAARKGGASEDDIREAGDRAFIAARKSTIKLLRTRINARRIALIAKLKKFDINARRKVKVPGPKYPEKRQAAIDRRAAMKETERGIRDELETLAVDYADLAAEARDLGEDLKALDRADEAEAAAAAADDQQARDDAATAAPTAGDFLDAAAAEAALTPGLDDDLAAAVALENQANADLDAARASGDPRRIADAARAALAARQNREQIEATMANTDALTANTEAITQVFGGSTVFAYRGQDYSLRSLAPPSSDRLVDAGVGL